MCEDSEGSESQCNNPVRTSPVLCRLCPAEGKESDAETERVIFLACVPNKQPITLVKKWAVLESVESASGGRLKPQSNNKRLAVQKGKSGAFARPLMLRS